MHPLATREDVQAFRLLNLWSYIDVFSHLLCLFVHQLFFPPLLQFALDCLAPFFLKQVAPFLFPLDPVQLSLCQSACDVLSDAILADLLLTLDELESLLFNFFEPLLLGFFKLNSVFLSSDYRMA